MVGGNYQPGQMAPLSAKIVLAKPQQLTIIAGQRIRWQLEPDIFAKCSFSKRISKIRPAPNCATMLIREPTHQLYEIAFRYTH
jgi:hypothetical protein